MALLRHLSKITGKTVVNGGQWVDNNGDGDSDAGEHVVYQLLIVNVGTVTLDSINLVDGAVTSEGVTCDPSIPDSLLPREAFDCRATYTVSVVSRLIAAHCHEHTRASFLVLWDGSPQPLWRKLAWCVHLCL